MSDETMIEVGKTYKYGKDGSNKRYLITSMTKHIAYAKDVDCDYISAAFRSDMWKDLVEVV